MRYKPSEAAVGGFVLILMVVAVSWSIHHQRVSSVKRRGVQQEPSRPAFILSETGFGYHAIRTVQHENHIYVCVRESQPLHHPDCTHDLAEPPPPTPKENVDE